MTVTLPDTSAGSLITDVSTYHLSVNRMTTAGDRNMHVLYNADLGIRDTAGEILRISDGGVVIAFDFDHDHDEVHFDPAIRSSVETLQRALECLRTALEAVTRAENTR